MASQSRISQRRREVWRRHLDGETAVSISKALGVTERTVRSDIKHCRESARQELAEVEEPLSFLAEVLEYYRVLRFEVWKDLDRATAQGDVTTRVKLISLLTKIRRDETDLLLRGGWPKQVPSHPSKLGPHISEEVAAKCEPELEALQVAIIAAQMSRTPEEVRALCGREKPATEVEIQAQKPSTTPSEQSKCSTVELFLQPTPPYAQSRYKPNKFEKTGFWSQKRSDLCNARHNSTQHSLLYINDLYCILW